MVANGTAIFGSVYHPTHVIVAGAIAENLDQIVDAAREILPGTECAAVESANCRRVGVDHSICESAASRIPHQSTEWVPEFGPLHRRALVNVTLRR